MKLTKALKLKNKLVKQANEAYDRLRTYNSVTEGQERTYDATAAYAEWMKATNDLIVLKAKIHVANAPIYQDIYQMAELKSVITKLKAIPTNRGTVIKNSYGTVETQVWSSIFGKVDLDKTIKEHETAIEQLQDKIEQFNATHSID